MTLPEYYALAKYWKQSPPEHESAAMFLEAYTNWEPERPPMTEEQFREWHAKSLERRWRAGAMNPKQIYEALGGRALGRSGAGGTEPGTLKNPPGIGPFPGLH